ncbi:Asp-tRNA(Asn)/Glu-tRNA(Gln) amidotransferase subunit GatC [uncultured Clostridium sp.]|uniref:Asp-tRNA(Asn)/Glu-tRNA(Gln) amidotransferase subunit GatC n=1 Tax=uncultured Clostridium sp. TaxID=59620 RepID=UPI0025FCA201|nr:Asp-tRNA(Asn)/Glu-tRNA(Gln) amidotransferase subunit GatC [uncultured Clostridium sp.]
MAVKIDDEMIEYVGILAQLELSGEEKKKAGEDMGRMLEYIDMLNGLDTSDTVPMSHLFDIRNVFREDEVTNTDMSQEMIANAPSRKEKQYKVPRTVE